jgi:sterol desaturase/sphingolipid hydroxylase (fatty acid hydroxylase superfamily)
MKHQNCKLNPGALEKNAHARLALCILFFVFVVRVCLQLVQTVFGLTGPVPMNAWDSGLMPYTWMFFWQIIVTVILLAILRLVDGQRRRFLGTSLVIFSLVYAMAMVTRAVVSLLGSSANPLFDMPVPTSIHFVLAVFFLVAGHQLRTGGKARKGGALRAFMRPIIYPAVLTFSLVLFAWSLRVGLAPAVAAYHALVLGTVAIIVAELLMPYRKEWGAVRSELATDAAYLALVQVALPALANVAVICLASRFDLSIARLWPSNQPVAVQVVLMLLIADFGRYWLHRASHAWPALWRLHAVHHAPEELHALNVGRFHPIEKLIQFTLDTVPFILLGASDTVVAGYLVFYAVNRFFQHSNVDVRRGMLNWIISGPELHRWHHARKPHLSDHNFGKCRAFE